MPGTRAYNKRVWNAPSPRPGLTEAGIQEMYRRVAKKLAEAKLGVPAAQDPADVNPQHVADGQQDAADASLAKLDQLKISEDMPKEGFKKSPHGTVARYGIHTPPVTPVPTPAQAVQYGPFQPAGQNGSSTQAMNQQPVNKKFGGEFAINQMVVIPLPGHELPWEEVAKISYGRIMEFDFKYDSVHQPDVTAPGYNPYDQDSYGLSAYITAQPGEEPYFKVIADELDGYPVYFEYRAVAPQTGF